MQKTGSLGPVPAIDRSTLADEIYRRLRRSILGGELTASERVQPDRLATIIGVSRTPVREALQRLLAEGYLVQEARHAFRVAPIDFQSGRELFAVRAVLEGLAARKTAISLAQDQRNDLAGTIRSIEGVSEDQWPDRIVGDFHRFVYRASGNQHLIQLLDRVFEQTLRYRFLTRSDDRERQQETLVDHQRILAALVDGRAEDAESSMREHIEALARRLDESHTH